MSVLVPAYLCARTYYVRISVDTFFICVSYAKCTEYVRIGMPVLISAYGVVRISMCSCLLFVFVLAYLYCVI